MKYPAPAATGRALRPSLRVVNFKDMSPGDLRDAVGPAIETGAENNHLLNAISQRLQQSIVDLACAGNAG